MTYYFEEIASCHELLRASLVVQLVKNVSALRETWVDPWVGKIPWKRARLFAVSLSFNVGGRVYGICL